MCQRALPGALAIVTWLLWLDAVLCAQHAQDAFIGWNGETYRPKHPGDDPHQEKTPVVDGGSPGGSSKRQWIETISWSPRAFIYHNFMTAAECDHVISRVKDSLSRSGVVDTDTGDDTYDPIRTSYGGVIGRASDPQVTAIEQRIAKWTRLPLEHGEAIQVLRYNDGQKYDAHWDWFDDPQRRSGAIDDNRQATVLLYLADVEEGGETALPLAVPIDASRQRMDNPSPCAARGELAVRPRKGDALLFWSVDPGGVRADRAALHASCPTTKGTKWTATKWIHNQPIREDGDPLPTNGQCRDTAGPECARWVQAGECDSKPEKMLGPGGKCRRSCEDCVDCDPTDLICLRKNGRSLRLQKTLRSTLPGAPPG